MPYMDETGLAYYNEKLQPWITSQPVKTIPSTLYPWTLTEKAGAVTCWPVGGTQLLPTVDFMFTEVPPASGDKGPENPSTIIGVSQIKVFHAENVMVPENIYLANTVEDIGGGWLHIRNNRLNSNSTGYSTIQKGLLDLDPAKSYSLVSAVRYALEYYSPGYSQSVTPTYVNFTTASNHVIQASVSGSKNWNDLQNTNIFELNQTGNENPDILFRVVATLRPHTFLDAELFLGVVDNSNFFNKHSIDLESTYYGGSVDLATGVMAVTHVAVTPDASTVDISSAPAALPLDYADTYGRTITSADGTTLAVGSAGGTVVYKLATPQTVQLSPTQILSLIQPDKYTPRLNAVYTDASSVQVGYVKSPIREEFELQQAVVAQGGSI